MFACRQCGKTVSVGDRISRSSLCPHCGAYLHSCIHCTFYSPGRHNDCREPQAEFVSDKRSSNFRDFFSPADSGDISRNKNSKKTARDTFNNLFNV